MTEDNKEVKEAISEESTALPGQRGGVCTACEG